MTRFASRSSGLYSLRSRDPPAPFPCTSYSFSSFSRPRRETSTSEPRRASTMKGCERENYPSCLRMRARSLARSLACQRLRICVYVCVYSMRECKLSHVGLRVCTTGRQMKNEVRSLRTFRAIVCGRVEEGDCAKGASLFPRCMYTTSFET